ncbi:MAG: hypothetical protein QXH91_07985 [Candidatus Bathyarchaeia archaeon]
MSEEKIVLKFKAGDAEIQFEGSRNSMLEMIEKDLPKIVENLNKILKVDLSASAPKEKIQTVIKPAQAENESYPSIQAKSCADAIITLLSTEWGKMKPRSISEITSAFEVNALHYSEKVIGFTLTRLTKKQKLRRWKTESGFVYTIA